MGCLQLAHSALILARTYVIEHFRALGECERGCQRSCAQLLLWEVLCRQQSVREEEVVRQLPPQDTSSVRLRHDLLIGKWW